MIDQIIFYLGLVLLVLLLLGLGWHVCHSNPPVPENFLVPQEKFSTHDLIEVFNRLSRVDSLLVADRIAYSAFMAQHPEPRNEWSPTTRREYDLMSHVFTRNLSEHYSILAEYMTLLNIDWRAP